MSLPKTESFPDDPDLMPPARRRRARRLLAPLEADERAAAIDHLARRSSPTFDFFIFSALSAVLFCIALWFDSAPLLLLGAVFAPLMAPAVGLAFGTVVGSYRFFGRSLAGFLVGGLLVFVVGAGGGLLTFWWPALGLEQAYLHARISWVHFIILAVGAIFTAATMAHSGRSPGAPSVALAYSLYLPLTIAGYGLTSGIPHLWPDALVVFAIYLAWAVVLGSLTLAILGFRPMTLFGYTLGGVVALLGVVLLLGFGAFGAVVGVFGPPLAVPTHTPTITPTLTPVPPTPTETPTPVPPSSTPTLTPTPSITPSPTFTASPTPLPVYARIDAGEESGGAFLRAEPGFDATPLTTLANGTLVQILPDSREVEGYFWVHVIVVSNELQGWVLQSLLSISTPEPQW
jgi:hypothetical protein